MQNTTSLLDNQKSQNKLETFFEGKDTPTSLSLNTNSITQNSHNENLQDLENSCQQIQNEGVTKTSQMTYPNLETAKTTISLLDNQESQKLERSFDEKDTSTQFYASTNYVSQNSQNKNLQALESSCQQIQNEGITKTSQITQSNSENAKSITSLLDNQEPQKVERLFEEKDTSTQLYLSSNSVSYNSQNENLQANENSCQQIQNKGATKTPQTTQLNLEVAKNTISLLENQEPQKVERLFEEKDTSPQLLASINLVSQSSQNKNLQALENSYQQIQTEGVTKISQMIQPNLQTDKKPHLDSFISYLVSNITDFCKNKQTFQEILDNLDLSSKQLNQILKVWEEFRVKLKEKQDQITQIQIKIDQENNNKSKIKEIEGNERLDIQNNTLNTLEREIEDLQKQIVQLIKQFKEYVMNYLQDKCKTINIDDINKLIEKLNLETGLENESEDMDSIMEAFDLTRKQEKEIKSELQKYSEEVLKIKDQMKQKNEQITQIKQQTIQIEQDNPEESLVKNFKLSLNQISEKDWSQNYNDILKELINYLKTNIEQDQQIQEQNIFQIIEDVELSRLKEKKVMSEINKFATEYKQMHESQKSVTKADVQIEQQSENIIIHVQNEVIPSSQEIKLEIQDKESNLKSEKNLSEIYTLVHQQQDHCLDQVSLKVICDFQKIQEMISYLRQNEVKTIALYGDFKLSIKIIQKYYSTSANLINLDSYEPPDYDKLVALTDGNLIFLIFQESRSTFEGEIFDNEEGQLFVRFLLDSCSIFITCLDQKQVIGWSDTNPFEEFEAIVPPNEYKDRSSISLKQIKINSRQQLNGNILLSNDQNNCMITLQCQLSELIDRNKLQFYKYQIDSNWKYINKLFHYGYELYYYVPLEKINDKNIKPIFNKHTELNNQIEQIYANFKNQIIQLQASLQEKSILENLLFKQKDQFKKNIHQEGQINTNQPNLMLQKENSENQGQELDKKVQIKENQQYQMVQEDFSETKGKELDKEVQFMENECNQMIQKDGDENQTKNQQKELDQEEEVKKSELQTKQEKFQNEQQKLSTTNFENLENTLQQLKCIICTQQIKNQTKKKQNCTQCLTYKLMVDKIHKEVENKRSTIQNFVNKFLYSNLNEILENIQQDLQFEKKQLAFYSLSKYINCQQFFTYFKEVLNDVLNALFLSFEEYSFYPRAMAFILNFIFITTYELIKSIVAKRQEINKNILIQKNIFLEQIDSCFERLKALKEERIFIQPFQFTYDPIKKEEVLLSINYKVQNLILNDQAHKLVDYISFDENVDYLVFNNCNEQDKIKQKTFIYILKKKQLNNGLQYAFSVPGSLDITLFINQYSRQWVIFANDTRKNSIGKINSDYSFEEGRIDTNVFFTKTQNGSNIEKIDSCIILNEKNNVIILYEKKKKQFYELFLSGQLKEIKFELSREVSNDGVVQLQNIPQEESGDIQCIKNSSEGDFYIFQTNKFLYLTNPNYTVKQQILLKENFQSCKLITTDNSILLIVLYQNQKYECYVIQGDEESEESLSMSSIVDEKNKIGNIVIDKMIKSMVHYGSNSIQIGCPVLVHQLFYYEQNQENKTQNFEKCIEKYFSDCIICKNISFNITHSYKNCFNDIDLMLHKLDSILQAVDSMTKSDLQFILQTRIPLQLTTIQQANYLPLKDGLFKQDLMNVSEVEDQIEQIKNQISFGWIENIVSLQNKEIYSIAMCGRQSVGKSSQLNRLFGTRFGVSASRCTDGIWIGLSKLEDRLILVMDCEGLFSIRRTDDEEVKLLLQITSISDITMVFCDIDGINQPLLSLFKKLQICAGKMQSDSFFLGTMVLLTKNVQDEGDKKKLQQEFKANLDKKEIKNSISRIFKRRGVSYGFLKSYLAKDYDSNLQKVRDDLLYKQILFKDKPKNPQFLMNILKYSMIQIYLNDDQDIDMISKQSEIKQEFNQFTSLFFDISNQKFIKSEKLLIQFKYQPISEEEKSLINDKSVFKYNQIFNQNSQIKSPEFQEQMDHTNTDIMNAYYKQYSQTEKEYAKDYKDITLNEQQKMNQLLYQEEIFVDITENLQIDKIYNKTEDQEIKIEEEIKSYCILELNQCDIKLYSQQSHNANLDKKSQNCEYLENIFFSCFRVLQRANFNNYVQQKQKFYNIFIEQRKNTIQEYFNNRMPKELKYRDLIVKFQQKFDTVIHSLDKQFIVCKQKCNKCNRLCVNIQGHKGNCNCETSHKCYFKCQICNNSNECFLISGHEGTHFCKEMNHLCQKDCQISTSCKELCTLEPHSEDIKHNCQSEHRCEYQCRLYNKCGKTCSLQSGHEEANHLCESTQCYDKCELCDKLCGFNLHDHDLLLSNPQKNKEFLMKDGKIITSHLCGDYHSCQQKCEKSGVCSITYKTEEKIWESKSSKFEYLFIKPFKSQKQCSIQIESWQTAHSGEHQCESSSTHRCDQQCPECLSYCYENYNHSGNHNSKNHRNKENCVFVSETDQIKLNSELGNTRSYMPGESSTPENCLQSCLRMGRAHVHLRVCKGGDDCAEKKYPLARHSTKKYKPFTYLNYDEMLCKGYWNSINWEPPAEEENLQIIQSCNTGCSHESHENNINYCIKQAWHDGPHQIDRKKCDHLGSGIVDICFTIDTTGSMEWAMSKVSQTVNNIVDKFEGKADIKYAIVQYRDHPPEDNSFVYKIESQLTDKNNILNVLNDMDADGGGDEPEAVMDGLYYTMAQIKWRENSQRFVFHICDSPPHGKQYGTSSNNPLWTSKGCPCGINECKIAEQLNVKKIFYYLVKVNSSLNMMESIFKSAFGSNFKQTIDLSDTSRLNIEIVQVLSKEISTANEFYHVKS